MQINQLILNICRHWNSDCYCIVSN